MNPWEARALEHQFKDKGKDKDKDKQNEDQATQSRAETTDSTQQLFYPGLYAPSGLDIMTVLFRVFARPNPQVDLGPVDASAAMVVCDLTLPDIPIIYASDAFLEMTGYEAHEVMGRNCRMLQEAVPLPVPGAKGKGKGSSGSSSGSSSSSKKPVVDKKVVRGMRDAVRANREHQARITNFRKGGEPFTNIVTMIPIPWDGQDYRYSVGFQCRVD